MIRVTVSVASEEAGIVQRAGEAFTRAATGLALEGIDAIVVFAQEDDEAPS